MKGLFILTIVLFSSICFSQECKNPKIVNNYDLKKFTTKVDPTNSRWSFCLSSIKTVKNVRPDVDFEYSTFVKLLPNGEAQIYYRDQMWSTKYSGFYMDIGYNFMIVNKTNWSINNDTLSIADYGSGVAVVCDSEKEPALYFQVASTVPSFIREFDGKEFPFIFTGAVRGLRYTSGLECGAFWPHQ